MDRRTLQLIDAMQHPGGEFVFQLVRKGALTEDELLQLVPDTSQSTGNRRLQELSKLGLLARAAGPRQYKERPWAVTVADAADAFIGSIIEMARAIGRAEEEQREIAESELRAARKRKRQLNSVDNRRSTTDG